MENYIISLNSCGFKLTEEEDHLLWSWNSINGETIAKFAYDAMLSDLGSGHDSWWFNSLWKWYIS